MAARARGLGACDPRCQAVGRPAAGHRPGARPRLGPRQHLPPRHVCCSYGMAGRSSATRAARALRARVPTLAGRYCGPMRACRCLTTRPVRPSARGAARVGQLKGGWPVRCAPIRRSRTAPRLHCAGPSGACSSSSTCARAASLSAWSTRTTPTSAARARGRPALASLRTHEARTSSAGTGAPSRPRGGRAPSYRARVSARRRASVHGAPATRPTLTTASRCWWPSPVARRVPLSAPSCTSSPPARAHLLSRSRCPRLSSTIQGTPAGLPARRQAVGQELCVLLSKLHPRDFSST